VKRTTGPAGVWFLPWNKCNNSRKYPEIKLPGALKMYGVAFGELLKRFDIEMPFEVIFDRKAKDSIVWKFR